MGQNDVCYELDPAVLDVWHRVSETYLTRSVFDGISLPNRLSRDGVWRLIQSLRRASGMEMPFEPLLDHEGENASWINLPADLRLALHRIAAQSSSGTELNRFLEGRTPRMRLSFMLDEMAAACLRDGLAIDRGRVRDVVQGRIRPATPEEKTIEAFCAIVEEECRGAQRTIDVEFVENVYALLDRYGAVEDSAKAAVRYSFLMSPHKPETLGSVAQLASDEMLLRYGSPVICWIGITTVMWDYQPLPRFNALVELVLRHVYLRQHHMAPLAYVDFLAQSLAWEAGRATRVSDILPFTQVVVDESGEGFDATPYFAGALPIIEAGLDHLSDQVKHAAAVESDMCELVESEDSLNMRQKGLLCELVCDVERPVTVEAYRRRFNVAHSTAVGDLRILRERGLLNMGYEGKRQVYRLSVSGVMNLR